MDREKLQSFIEAAEGYIRVARSGLLVAAQSGEAPDLAVARRGLADLNDAAAESGLDHVVKALSDWDAAVYLQESTDNCPPGAATRLLDHLARIEAAMFEIPLSSDDFLLDVDGLVDGSFEWLTTSQNSREPAQGAFEIDDETLDIFRSEAEELMSKIDVGLRTVSASPGDQNALWDIRRAAHTLKGAAGIVGLKNACETAHQMEDVLDRLVETQRKAGPLVLDFLGLAARRLTSIVSLNENQSEQRNLDTAYQEVTEWLEAEATRSSDSRLPVEAEPRKEASTKSTTTPVVRVSLDRLDELIKLSQGLLINRSAFAVILAAIGDEPVAISKLNTLFDVERRLTDELHAKLLRIRMVKFGTLATRLNRAVNATAEEENKKAWIEIKNAETEVDTQVIDALIEPLLHLLKNAVVHGIELPETRRLIGKPDRGEIQISVESDAHQLTLSVADDGAGISLSKLKAKAVARGILSQQQADKLRDDEALKLVFDRGLTTAEKVDLNAGRGIGMSIVKESVESRGGTVAVQSRALYGTTFEIRIPLRFAKLETHVKQTPVVQPVTNTRPLIMLVEDSESIRRRTVRLIEESGYRVITASDGAEALEILLSGSFEPDLILSDIEMPQIDGWEFLEYVKTDDNLGHIPVVIVSSLDGDEHRRRALELGANDYLIKPFDRSALEKILATFNAAEACLV